MKWLPSSLTALNLLSGLGALILTFAGRPAAACWLILCATLFDGLDGRLARWLKQENDFGRKFDSCADFVSFGCAPAFLFYGVCPNISQLVLAGASFLFTFSSFFRLVRFNRNYQTNKMNGVEYFEGLPTTASGGLVASLFLFFNPIRGCTPLYPAVLLVLSGLMVSKIPYPNFKYIYLGLVPVGICLIGGILSIFGFQNQAPLVPFSIFSGYTLFGGLERRTREKLRSV